jgi:putative PIN family toxin of toxin-antitoxin system
MNRSRFVFDTNTLVSAVLIANSVPDQALTRARHLGILLFSEQTFAEFQQVITRSKFDQYVSLTTRLEFLVRLKDETEGVAIAQTVTVYRDPNDNQFLEAAVSGNANFIITGDQDLLVLNPFQNIEIISPAKFLEEFSQR